MPDRHGDTGCITGTMHSTRVSSGEEKPSGTHPGQPGNDCFASLARREGPRRLGAWQQAQKRQTQRTNLPCVLRITGLNRVGGHFARSAANVRRTGHCDQTVASDRWDERCRNGKPLGGHLDHSGTGTAHAPSGGCRDPDDGYRRWTSAHEGITKKVARDLPTRQVIFLSWKANICSCIERMDNQ